MESKVAEAREPSTGTTSDLPTGPGELQGPPAGAAAAVTEGMLAYQQ